MHVRLVARLSQLTTGELALFSELQDRENRCFSGDRLILLEVLN